jgi:hypothetical protein
MLRAANRLESIYEIASSPFVLNATVDVVHGTIDYLMRVVAGESFVAE